MNPTAVKEAAKNNFPMDHLIGNWWAGGDDDARPAGDGAKGYLSLDFNQVGTNFPVIQDIIKYTVDKGKSQTPKDRVGENFYNRGVLNAMIIAEAIRNAQKLTGKKVITGEDMRRGLETLTISAARLKEMGATGFAAPMNVSCTDHNGHNAAYMAKWDGTKWVKGSDWIEPIKNKVVPLIEAAAKDYVGRQRRLAEAHRSLRQVVVRRDDLPSPRVRGERVLLSWSRHVGCSANRQASGGGENPLRQQYRSDLRSRHPGAQGRVARRAEGRHRRAARRQRRRQDHHAEGDLQSAACRARRRHQGLDRVRRRRGAGPFAQRTGAARLHPGDGRPAVLRPSHHRGEPADRRFHAARRQGGDPQGYRPGLFLFPQARRAARARSPATPPAASSRCARSAAR